MVLLPTRGLALALGFTMPILTAFAVFVRFYMRRRRSVTLQADDWLCIPAWLITTGLCVMIIYASESNLFIQDNLPVGDTVNPTQKLFAEMFGGAFPILWAVCTTCVKMSILLFYRRIFVGKAFNSLSWFLIGFTSVWFLLALFSWLFYCGTHLYENFHGSWEVCPTWTVKLQIGVYVWDTVIDFGILMLPWPFVLNLHVNAQRKFELLFAFLLGSFAFVASLVNTVFQCLELVDEGIFNSTDNAQGPELVFFYWQTIEIGVGLLACNLPTLQPLYNIFLAYIWSGFVRTRQTVYSWRYGNSGVGNISAPYAVGSASGGRHSKSPGTPGTFSNSSTSRKNSKNMYWVLEDNAPASSDGSRGMSSPDEVELVEQGRSKARPNSKAEDDLLRRQLGSAY